VTAFVEVPVPAVTLGVCPDARAYTDGTVAVITSRDAGSLHVSVSCRDRAPTDEEIRQALHRVAPRVLFDEERGAGINRRVRHFWERAS
jgi:hypothetical protein